MKLTGRQAFPSDNSFLNTAPQFVRDGWNALAATTPARSLVAGPLSSKRRRGGGVNVRIEIEDARTQRGTRSSQRRLSGRIAACACVAALALVFFPDRDSSVFN
jgi:hypothetical protein